ncbi:iron complex transport system ATP-binding protein [Epibacterium ulvae]|uniref:Iron complex transport system ATP-binding protein n=1 Tax=Epibacterium ulvae TaxID=1156985 RepID=A0A1G5QUH8_9RHOB|nr:ATP-binding cassette domain-containing protein [Epibacterium ulvae]SCZ64729.1 iron complex transport system ATP-binding protein [Epibacterium ulvae]
MIQIKSLSHTITDTPILQDINLELPQGQITALIGPNGAGKSTLLNAIGRQIEVAHGTVTLDGSDITQIAPRDLARQMAVVAQHLAVGSRIRVADLVGFGRWPHSQGRTTPTDQTIIEQAIEEFDLIALRHRFLDELSGGQRQRAFIAMAYAQDTCWLLLDEPLNNLDLKHARTLMAQLRRMVEHAGKSVVIVLHDLNYTLSWADHVVAMCDGKVVFTGPAAQVATAQSLTDLYETPIQISTVEGQVFARYHR